MARCSIGLYCWLVASVAFAQLEVKAQVYYKLDGARDATVIDSTIFYRTTQPVVSRPVGIVKVTSEAANITVEAETQGWLPVNVERLASDEGKYWMIEAVGKVRIEITAIDFEQNIYAKQRKILDIIGPGPPPEPTPDPDVDPEPEPEPDVDPPPMDVDSIHMLIVYESADSTKLTDGQREMFYNLEARSFYNKTFGMNWRILDKDTYFKDPENKWAKALQRDRTESPWVIISNGTTGYEGPLPNNLAEFKGLVEIYK